MAHVRLHETRVRARGKRDGRSTRPAAWLLAATAPPDDACRHRRRLLPSLRPPVEETRSSPEVPEAAAHGATARSPLTRFSTDAQHMKSVSMTAPLCRARHAPPSRTFSRVEARYHAHLPR
eukprot:2394719-Prymnesium_polylepis.2